MEGRWWADGRPLLRVVDLGLPGKPLKPLLTDPAAVAPAGVPETIHFALEPHRTVADRPLADWYRVSIGMHTFEADDLAEAMGLRPGQEVIPPRDFPRLWATMHGQELPGAGDRPGQPLPLQVADRR